VCACGGAKNLCVIYLAPRFISVNLFGFIWIIIFNYLSLAKYLRDFGVTNVVDPKNIDSE
jgi:hypothetical protein